MPVQAADALQQHVGRAQISQQEVEVHIKALLDGLRRHHDPGSPGCILADPTFERVIQQLAVLAGEPVSPEQKPSVGCNIKWRRGNEPEYFN